VGVCRRKLMAVSQHSTAVESADNPRDVPRLKKEDLSKFDNPLDDTWVYQDKMTGCPAAARRHRYCRC
jgi:hypothetical protein